MNAPSTEQRLVQVLLRAVQTALRYRRIQSTKPPVREAADSALEMAFAPIWKRVPRLDLQVTPASIVFDGSVALAVEEDAEGLISSLTAVGIHSVTLVPGVELEEIKLLLTAVSAAPGRRDKPGSDLLTSLFRADFNYVEYQVVDSHAHDDHAIATQQTRIASPEPGKAGAPEVVRETVRQDVAIPLTAPSGVVQLERFDSTLYFLDEREIEYLKSSIDREYARDLALGTLSILLDILELQKEPAVRKEVIAILADFLPDLLGGGRFEAVAHLISGVREVARDAAALTESQKDALDRLRASISHPRALAQLFHALEGGGVDPTPESMGVLLRELRPAAIRQVLAWSDQLSDPGTRNAVVVALDSFFTEWPHSLSRMLNASDRDVVQAGLELATRLKHPEFIEIVAAISTHEDPSIRRLVAKALASIGNAASFRRLTGLAEDADRDVRVLVYRTFAARPFRGAQGTLQRAITSKDLEKKGPREKRSLFEAFGAVSGEAGVADLALLLSGRSHSGPRPSSHTRACAATALGVIGTPNARAALDRAARDRDPLVRRAVSGALRGAG